jgi:hypothetical protein
MCRPTHPPFELMIAVAWLRYHWARHADRGPQSVMLARNRLQITKVPPTGRRQLLQACMGQCSRGVAGRTLCGTSDVMMETDFITLVAR